jgi:hypothetical protein
MRMKTKQIVDGDVVNHFGYEFVVSDVKGPEKAPDGHLVWYYTGRCTASRRNDFIRNTGYDGGRYSSTTDEQTNLG